MGAGPRGDEEDAWTPSRRPSRGAGTTPSSSTWTASSPRRPPCTRRPGSGSSTRTSRSAPPARARARAARPTTLCGPSTSTADYRLYVDGKPRYDGVRDFLASRGIELPMGDPSDPPERETVCGLGNRKNDFFNAEVREHGVKTFPSTVALIHQLRDAGIRVGLMSSSKNTAMVLDVTGTTDLFEVRVDGVVAAEVGLPGKPDPAMYLETARRLGVDAARSVVVEDALSGVEAGRRGGFGLVIGVDRLGQAAELARGRRRRGRGRPRRGERHRLTSGRRRRRPAATAPSLRPLPAPSARVSVRRLHEHMFVLRSLPPQHRPPSRQESHMPSGGATSGDRPEPPEAAAAGGQTERRTGAARARAGRPGPNGEAVPVAVSWDERARRPVAFVWRRRTLPRRARPRDVGPRDGLVEGRRPRQPLVLAGARRRPRRRPALRPPQQGVGARAGDRLSPGRRTRSRCARLATQSAVSIQPATNMGVSGVRPPPGSS